MTLFLDESIWTWSHFLFGITYAFTTSVIFLFVVLVFFRPKIEISPFICKQVNNLDKETDYFYVFKIINKSYFSAFDVQLECFKTSLYRGTSGGINVRFKNIELKINSFKHIPPFQKNKEGRTSPHCMLFRTNEKLSDLLINQDVGLRIQVTLRHGLSGLATFYVKDFTPSSIKEGEFAFGNKVEVL
jgi:hypothetical protein